MDKGSELLLIGLIHGSANGTKGLYAFMHTCGYGAGKELRKFTCNVMNE